MSFDERTLNGMSILVAVVRVGSFAAAAKELRMSQPGVSRSIARLESRLGVRLLERTTRSLALTEEGRTLHAQVLPLLNGLEEAVTSLKEANAGVSGTLRVNIDPFVAQLLLGPHLRTFMQTHPLLRLELTSSRLLDDVVSSGYDLAVRFGEPLQQAWIARKLLETRVLTVASPAYLKRHGTPRIPRDLAEGRHVLIDLIDPATGRPFEWIFQKARQQVSVPTDGRLLLNDVATMHSLCLAGYGVAQLLHLGTEQLLATGKLVELFPDWSDERFPLFAYYPSKQHLPRKTRAFLDFMIGLVAGEARKAGL